MNQMVLVVQLVTATDSNNIYRQGQFKTICCANISVRRMKNGFLVQVWGGGGLPPPLGHTLGLRPWLYPAGIQHKHSLTSAPSPTPPF